MIVLRLPSPFSSSSLTAARSPSSKIGSETTYFSLAQLPRSRRRHRSLQKGKSACTVESDIPFCSERCRLRDLGNWASEKYVVSDPIFDEGDRAAVNDEEDRRAVNDEEENG